VIETDGKKDEKKRKKDGPYFGRDSNEGHVGVDSVLK
jgi:hypothetical protein